MSNDPFGNLQDWGRVLSELHLLEKNGGLEQCQPGLIRLLKFPGNWQIRHQALIAVRKIGEPDPALMETITEVLADPGCYTDTRILAAKALGDLGRSGKKPELPEKLRSEILTSLMAVLASPEAPILHRTVEEAVQKIEDQRTGAARAK